MLGSKGQYLIHPDSNRLLRKTITSDIDPINNADIIAIGHQMITGKEGHMHAVVNGRDYHVTYMPISRSNFSIALVCPESEILKSFNLLTYIIIILIIIGLAFIYWLCRRGVGHAIRPINYLLDRAKQISEGHYDVEIPRTNREDAVGQLQNSFATMQHSIVDHISSIRQTTEETRRSNEELAAAMKLAEEAIRQKNLFVQNVSHQIRTPLNIILGFSQILRDSPDLKVNELKEIRDMMKHNAIHLNRMVNMLYDSSDTGTSEAWQSQLSDQVSCNEVARDSIDYTKSHFPGLAIRFESEVPDSLSITANRRYLMRPLRELLYNAAKYSDGEHISLRVSQTEASVRFTIEDVGPGLSAESLENLFKPFIKLNDLSEGLGLGLSLARYHVISQGGVLDLDTTYHDGCRFNIIMPK